MSETIPPAPVSTPASGREPTVTDHLGGVGRGGVAGPLGAMDGAHELTWTYLQRVPPPHPGLPTRDMSEPTNPPLLLLLLLLSLLLLLLLLRLLKPPPQAPPPR